MIDADGLAASVAIFREDGVKAVEAVRSRVSHDVALAAQHPVALETGKVTHVPRPTLRLRALVSQDQLWHSIQNKINI